MPAFQGNTYSSNRYHGVRFDNPSVPDGQQAAWRHPGAPYSIGGRVNIGNKATLTLPAGLVVKFGQRELLDVYGTLIARGTASQPVVFTALTDDTGGDTNGDRDTTKAAAGWWRNIWFEPSGSGTLDHCKVLYAGASDNAAILCAGETSPTVSNSEVSSSSGNGILVLDTAKPTLSPNNILEKCGGFGVRNDGSAAVNAEDNWWGDASGPLHPTLNAGGKGLKVSDRVDFSPYLTQRSGGGWGIIAADSTTWASSVAGFSSQYGTSDWAATQALGPPNTATDHADYKTAWASAGADDRRESLEVSYATPTAIVGVDIYETFNPGAVDTVQARDPDGGLHLLWSGQAKEQPKQARVFSLRFPATTYPVKGIRISLNSPAVPGWNEIDAVGILPVGAQPPGAGPAISLSDTTLEFASVAVGTSAQKTLTVTNKGGVNLTISGIGVTGTEEFQVSPTTGTVEPGKGLALTVTFAPTSAGNKAGALHITHNAAGGLTAVRLYGTGSASAGPLTPKAGDGSNSLGVGDAKTSALGNVKPGQKVEVPITFNQEVAASTGFSVKLTFDPKKLKVAGGKKGEAFSAAIDLPPQTKDNVVEYGASFLGGNATAKGALGSLTFEALADFSGETEVVLTEVSIKISGGSKNFKPGASVVISSGAVAGGGPPSPDFDGDGEVGFSDFFEFAVAFGQKATGANAKFDLDGDGDIGFGDFFAFATEFGKKL